MSESEIKRAIKSLQNLSGRLTGVHYENARTVLQEAEGGLAGNHIKSILELLINAPNCGATGFRDILLCCVPATEPLSSDIIDIAVLWMLYKCSDESVAPSKINAVLDWVSGLLEFNLIERDNVDCYYEMLYRPLLRDQCQRQASKLIHMLTRPDDIYRARVESIIKLYRKSGGKAKHLAVLIELFKTFKPEYVPENVRSYSLSVAFKTLPPGFQRNLEAAQKRLQSQPGQNISKAPTLDWTAVTRNDKKNKLTIPLIPAAMYIHLGSELYREKRRKVIDFLNKVSLASYHLSCEVPTSILSLMLNEGGIHFLASHNNDIHARFSSVLYSCLKSVFLLNNKNVSYEERDHFLGQLVVLEDYMQQGIPVVSRFLATYIASWNGFAHQKHIYRLLERINLSHFSEFNDCIIQHLQTLFLSGDLEEKNLIINSLANLTFNLHNTCSSILPKRNLFLGEVRQWETDFNTVLPQLVDTVIGFCTSGLMLTSNAPAILHTSLSFFETLAELQTKSKQQVNIIPSSIFYRCLFSSDFSALARACSLLLQYKNIGFISSPNFDENYKIHCVDWLNKYSCDLWNCFVKKRAFSKSSQGHALLMHGQLKSLLIRSPDSAFSLEFHPYMIGLALLLQDYEESSISVLPVEVLRDTLKISFKEFCECLDALEMKYAECHES